MKIILSAVLLIWAHLSFGHDALITGKVVDENEKGVLYSTIALYHTSDTTMVKAAATDELGKYFFSDIPVGTYFVFASYMGCEEVRTASFHFSTSENFEVPTIRMIARAEDLAEIVVKSSRPIVEVHPDKTVFNVDGSINAVGNTALELLRKSPGVVVDNNDNLLLQGKNGVQVYINGKVSPLSGEDLANYLKSMQSSEIDAIEIITNPSAKYDAEGNAGIINIRLKKNQNLGFNGTANLGFGQANNSIYNGSINFNYRNKLFNTFGSYSHQNRTTVSDFFLYREQGGNIYDQNNHDYFSGLHQNFRLGTDFFIDKKNTLGILINGSTNDADKRSDSHTEISNLSDGKLDSFLIASNTMVENHDNLNINVNYAYNAGGEKTLNIDLDYGMYRNTGTSFQPNRYLETDGETILFERIFSNVTPTNIDIYTAKIDFESNLLGGRFGLGAKTSLVTTDNTFDNFDIIEDVRKKNLDRSNNFIYEESINAAYSSWQRKFGEKFNIMLGLRMEYTDSKGDLTSNQNQNDQVVSRAYLDFFPSGGLTMQANGDHSFRINYSRRIDRPNYQSLNPFEYKLDELTFKRGNPFLNPQYSNSYSFTHTYKQKLNSTLSYTIINDVFTNITDAVDERAATLTFVNLAQQTNLAMTVSYPWSVAKWWNMYTTATAYRLHNDANIDGKIIDLAVNAFRFYGQNTFLLPRGYKLELSGWYNAPTLWGNWVTGSQYDVSVGASKSLWQEKATLKISVADLFHTNGWGGESQFGSLHMKGGGQWESRRISLNFTYLFGNKQVQGTRKRNTGLEDEQRRI